MDPTPRGDPYVVGSASSRFACLDLNEEASCHMETDFLMEVPDTPDRVSARFKERNVACENVSTSSSMGLRRRDGHHRWPRNLTSEARGSSGVAVNSNSSTRREKQGSLTLRSLEARGPTPLCGGTTEPKCDLQGSTLVPGQAGVSGKNEHEMCGKVIDTRLKNIADSGSTRCMNGSSDRGKDMNRHSCLDFGFQVINLEPSPQSRPAASMVNGVVSESTDRSIEILKSIDTGEGVDPSSDSQKKRLQDESRTLKLGPPKTTGQRMSMRNGCLPRNIIEKGINSDMQVGGKGRLSSDGTSRDKGKVIELSPDSVPSSKAAMPSSSDVDACSRIPRPRRLVRNGCISPANIARNKAIVAEVKDVNNNSPSIENPLFDSLQQMHSSSNCHGKDKGKNIVDEGHLLNSEVVETISSSSRLDTMPSNVTVGDTDEEISWFVEEPGWITTGNRRGLSNGTTVVVDGVGHVPRCAHENNADEGQHVNIIDDIDPSEFAASQPNSLRSNPVLISSNVNHHNENIRQQGSQRLIKGKRKIRSGRFMQGETSKAESSDLLSPLGESSNILSTSTANVEGVNALLRSVIDVDEFSPPQIRRSCPRNGNISVSDGSSERALQVEYDELLARQLQEQLFNESLGSGSFEEIDAGIAWRLQQEEDAQIISSTRSRRQSQPRDPFTGHLYRRYPRHSSRNPSGQPPRQPRSMPRISQLRRNLNRNHMDLESRLNYLEALEAAFNNSNDSTLPTSLHHMERDFNENDYEMLLALDNENHNHAGASRHQINSLPLSVVQTENPEETCAICLDVPSIGDKIRHLPCLHKFHKDCIDTWLRRKTSCPVCKSGIT